MWLVIFGKGNVFFIVDTLLTRKFGWGCDFCGIVNVGITVFVYFCTTLNDKTNAHIYNIIVLHAVAMGR